MAEEVVERLDFDVSQFDSLPADRFAVGVRSRVLDDRVREFLAAHPGAVVLDLGCGLDSRVFRVDPAAGHRWYDLDFPDVIEVKREPYRASGAVRL